MSSTKQRIFSRLGGRQADEQGGRGGPPSTSEESKSDQQGGRDACGSFPCFLPVVLLLTGLLLTTLHLLRHDNKQLASAKGYIRRFNQHIQELEEEVSSSLLLDKFADAAQPRMSALTSPSCPNELEASRKQLLTLAQTARDLEGKIRELQIQAASSEGQLAALQKEKEVLGMQVSTMQHDKRILAKRLGNKMVQSHHTDTPTA